MTRKVDEKGTDRFDINGTMYALVKPKNFKEVVAAIEVKSVIEACIADNILSFDGKGYQNLLTKQQDYIQEYINGLGDYDKNILIDNISFFLQKYNLRMGELERLIGVSAGYLSRTARENSAKKLSVDVVWKLARLFGVDIRTLLAVNLKIPNSNTKLVATFLEKLCDQTVQNKIKWQNRGGLACYLDKAFIRMDLFSEDEDGPAFYKPTDHMNPEYKYVLTKDIYTCSGIVKGKELAVVTFSFEGEEQSSFFDFLFLSQKGISSIDGYHWEKAFYSIDDPLDIIKYKGKQLLDIIQTQEIDADISPETRDIITDYLK